MPARSVRKKRPEGGGDSDMPEIYTQKIKKKVSRKKVAEENQIHADSKVAQNDHLNNNKESVAKEIPITQKFGDRLSDDSVVECHLNFKERKKIPYIQTFLPSYQHSGNMVHFTQQYSQGQLIPCRLQQSVTRSIVDMVSDMQLCRTASPFDRRVTAMEWHPTNPNVVAVGSKGGDIIIWNTRTMNKDKFIQGMGAGGIINSLKFWPEDSSRIVSAAVDGTVTLHDVEGRDTRILADTMNPHDYWYCSVDIQSRGKFVVAGDNVGKVQFLSYDGKMIFNQKLHKKKVTCCEFSPREEWLLCTASTDQTVKFWDVRNVKDKNSAIYSLPHECPVNSAYFSRTDGCRLLTTDQNNQVRVYSAPEWYREKTILHPHRFFQHITPIKATWHPLQDLAVIGRYPDPKFPGYHDSEPRTIDIIDVEKEEVVANLNDPAAPGLVCCRHVILAIPLPLQTRIVYDPPLPALRNQLIQRVPMGSVIKTFVYYDRPFWREMGYCGSVVIDDDGALAEFTSDECKVDGSKPAIMGFILADRARKYVNLTKEERRDRLCQMYAKVFHTDQALKCVHYEEMNWLEEQWSGGCYTVMMPPGFLTTFGRELRKPVGQIYFAGTETATQWSGYMEGAVQAGERAAREILYARGDIEESEIWQEEPENDKVKPRPFEKSIFERYAPSVGGFLAFLGCLSAVSISASFFLYRKLRK